MKNVFFKINNLFIYLFGPLLFLLLNLITAIFALNGYNYTFYIDFVLVRLLIFLLITIILALFIGYFSSKSKFKIRENFYLNNIYWNIIVFFIFISNFSEYMYFGIPLLSLFGIGKRVIYAEYGFSLIHHFSVSSWILVFVKPKKKKVRFLYILFALINPLLIVNRDLLMLTCFCFLIKVILNKKKSIVPTLVIIFVLLIFGVLGNIRSGTALKDTALPIKNEVIRNSDIGLWLYTYITSAWFNSINNINTKLFIKQYSNINTFVEAYFYYAKYDVIGFVGFYIITFMFLCILNKIRHLRPRFTPFYLYFLYQSYMSIFAAKIYSTNMYFVLFIFITSLIFDSNQKLFFKLAISTNNESRSIE